jgi:DNA end-binding protein Ku
MPRSIWNGSLSFGLVNVPVELYSATTDKTIHFNQFEDGTSDRIRYKRVNERTGDEVDFAHIVKGYDLGGGDYVLLSQEELEAVEPGRSRTIDVTDFVDQVEIDPILYRKAYYLAPKDASAAKAYRLLQEAMAASGKVGIAMFVMRAKQYLVTIRPEADVLALETMYFADEVLAPDDIKGLPVEADFTDRELKAAQLLIESMASDWDPERYQDTYRQQVEALVEAKRQGEEIVTEVHQAQPTKVVNLLDALNASVAAARGRRPSAPADGDEPAPAPAVAAPTDRSPGRRRAGPKATPRAVEAAKGLSKSDLYDRATELGVAGRSKMSRQELEAAVAAASAPQRRRRAS